MKIFIGIDPGLNGGFAALFPEENKLIILPMPLIGDKDYDVVKLASMFKNIKADPKDVFVTIEKQMALPGQGLTSTLKTGTGFGLLIGIVAALEIPYQIIPPQKWQRQIFVGLPAKQDTKVSSEIMAKRLFPSEDFLKTGRCKKASDGLTDAACIAEYGRRVYNNEIDTGSVFQKGCEHVVLKENPTVCTKCGHLVEAREYELPDEF